MRTGRRHTCPYNDLPKRQFWKQGVLEQDYATIDLGVDNAFAIYPHTKIATSGSCFAQNISRYLSKSGYNYFVTEPGPSFISERLRTLHNYSVFSARFGNVYTARQLVQLFDRAYGNFKPVDRVWLDGDEILDPYRPRIQPGGFASIEEFNADQSAHFAAVRRMFSELDVFVFTLGLTEAYTAVSDGAVYPVCPGCAGGTFDPSSHAFTNFTYEDVKHDMEQFVDRLKSVNSDARIILTVSPVPLVATAEPRHVLVSTTYSKSVLRAVAGYIAEQNDRVVYFPSYDLIASPPAAGRYFEPDLRNIRDEGVAHVMRIFFAHFCEPMTSAGHLRSSGLDDDEFLDNASSVHHADTSALAKIEARMGLVCDEEVLGLTDSE